MPPPDPPPVPPPSSLEPQGVAPAAPLARTVPLSLSRPATETWTAPPPAPPAVLQPPARPPAHPPISGTRLLAPRATPAIPPFFRLPSVSACPPLPPAVPKPPPPPPLAPLNL